MSFNEERFLSSISLMLRFSIGVFILFSVLGYISKMFDERISKVLLNYAVFYLVITPLLRLFLLAWGFKKLKETKYFTYSLAILITIILGATI